MDNETGIHCTQGGEEHSYQTTFDDGELWQGVCSACGAEGEEEYGTPPATVTESATA